MNGDSTSAKRTPCYRCGGKECSHKHWRTGKLGFEETVINIMWTRFFLGVKAEDIEEALSMFEKNETKELKKTIEKLSKKIRSEEDALNGLIDAMSDPDIRALTKPRVLKKTTGTHRNEKRIRHKKTGLSHHTDAVPSQPDTKRT